ncbi:hypothetical protein [Arenimonas oryziterrae]|uniref:Uncharacterized protein n=1 Tax=Arenimonas oryziterrae DSM 21050 = YC6267 TaxID=1121015 RepID=A0A091AV67_9GAMM|nr:hypothetical protein [Arenimonas oryziterrae]KFN42549.1 hypothetical protein N789_12990 [Arenimonas oryziterrae DSM 21050 = YC6267]
MRIQLAQPHDSQLQQRQGLHLQSPHWQQRQLGAEAWVSLPVWVAGAFFGEVFMMWVLERAADCRQD